MPNEQDQSTQGAEVDRSDAADARRLRWIVAGNGYFLEEEMLRGDTHDVREQDRIRVAIDARIADALGTLPRYADLRGTAYRARKHGPIRAPLTFLMGVTVETPCCNHAVELRHESESRETSHTWTGVRCQCGTSYTFRLNVEDAK